MRREVCRRPIQHRRLYPATITDLLRRRRALAMETVPVARVRVSRAVMVLVPEDLAVLANPVGRMVPENRGAPVVLVLVPVALANPAVPGDQVDRENPVVP